VGLSITQRICEVPASFTDYKAASIPYTIPSQVLDKLYLETGVTALVKIQGGSNMNGTDFYVNKPHCAAAVRP